MRIQKTENSTISLWIDFVAQTLSFTINGKYYGKAFDIKNSRYIPVICAHKSGNSIQLLLYERNGMVCDNAGYLKHW